MTARAALSQVNQPIDPSAALGTATKQYADGKQPLDSDLTTIAGLAVVNDSVLQGKAGAWAVRTPAQLKTDLVLAKGDVGLGNVDNTSDTAKPVSTAQQTALDAKQALDSDLTSIAAIAPANDDVIQRKAGAWTNRTLAQLKTDLSVQPLDTDLTTIAGLTATTDSFIQAKSSAWASRTIAQVKTDLAVSNLDNTSDANKPVSAAQQTAIDGRARRIKYGFRTTVSSNSSANGQVIAVLRLASVAVLTGFAYSIKAKVYPNSDNTGDLLRYDIRFTTDGVTTPTASSPVMPRGVKYAGCANSTFMSSDIDAYYSPGSNLTLWVVLCVQRVGGTGNCNLYADTTERFTELEIWCTGVDVANTGTAL